MPERALVANCNPGVLGQRQMVASTVAGRAQGGLQSVRILLVSGSTCTDPASGEIAMRVWMRDLAWARARVLLSG